MAQTQRNTGHTLPQTYPGLTQADIEKVRAALVSSEGDLARQADLIELHKRMVGLFATLNEGLEERQAKKAAADRQAIEDRIETMEVAVNRMEGALVIELEPMLDRNIAERVATLKASPRSGAAVWRVMWVFLAGFCSATLVLLLFMQIAVSKEISESFYLGDFSPEASPFGGIPANGDVID